MQLKRYTFIIILLFCIQTGLSQDIRKSKYIIMTFVEDYSLSLHGATKYYWVIPEDSIKSFQNNLYKLYISSFSISQFKDCMNDGYIDPKIRSLKKDDYEFDSTWFVKHDQLVNLIDNERKLIQTVKKTWKHSKSKVTISVYATPIIAEFCSCKLLHNSKYKLVGENKIYLASNFSTSNKEFWKSTLSEFILKQDYSYFTFK
jgi:hypothetical protein